MGLSFHKPHERLARGPLLVQGDVPCYSDLHLLVHEDAEVDRVATHARSSNHNLGAHLFSLGVWKQTWGTQHHKVAFTSKTLHWMEQGDERHVYWRDIWLNDIKLHWCPQRELYNNREGWCYYSCYTDQLSNFLQSTWS